MSHKIWALVVGPKDGITVHISGDPTSKLAEVANQIAHADLVVYQDGENCKLIKTPKAKIPAVDGGRFTELEVSEEKGATRGTSAVLATAQVGDRFSFPAQEGARFSASTPPKVETEAETETAKPAIFARYEYVAGTSNKFWEIRVEGWRYVTRWGRIGTEGSVTVKEWSSSREAQREAEKLVSSKVAKGYKRKW